MLRIFAWLGLTYIVFEYVSPFIKAFFAKGKIRAFFRKLDSQQYKVLEDINIPIYHLRVNPISGKKEAFSKTSKTGTVDYLVISKSGIISITLLDLKYPNSGLQGNENHDYWNIIRFARMALPFGVDFNSYKKIPNPITNSLNLELMLRMNLGLDDSIPVYSIIIIVPRIKAVDIRDKESNCWLIFPSWLKKTVSTFAENKISSEKVNEIYEKINLLGIQERLGLLKTGGIMSEVTIDNDLDA